MQKQLFLLIGLLAFTAVSATTAAETAADPASRGEAIARAADARLHGFGDFQATLTMELTSADGQTATRTLRVSARESAPPAGNKPAGASAGTDQTLMVFDTPRDLAGTALLTWSQPQGSDEQWLYLPAIKRVKQIGSRNKSGPFMASEFAFEDIATPYWQKFRYRFLREETLDGLPCAVIERIASDPDSGYSKQIVWIDTGEQLIRRIDYFDRRNTLLKTYLARGFVQHNGKHWRPAEMLMHNMQTQKKTTLRWSQYRFNTGLKESDFSQNALQRVK